MRSQKARPLKQRLNSDGVKPTDYKAVCQMRSSTKRTLMRRLGRIPGNALRSTLNDLEQMKTEEQIREQAVCEVEAWLRQRAIRLSKENAEPLEIVALMAAAEALSSECLWMTS